MGTLYLQGRATAVAKVATATFATYDVATTRTITIGGVAISAADSGGTLTTAMTALAVLLNASTHPYFSTITWTSNATQIIGTADTAGVDFVFAGSVSGGTGTLSNAFSVTTANAGPGDFAKITNYNTGAAPASSDDLYYENLDVNVAWSLDQNAVTLTSFNIAKSYTGFIGLPIETFATSADGETDVSTAVEYRNTYLKISATTLNIGYHYGDGSPAGSGRIKINLGSVQSTINVYGSGTAEETSLKAVRLLGTHASNVLNVFGGSVGIAADAPGEVSTILTANLQIGSLQLGAGVTLTTYNQVSGTGLVQCGGTTASIFAGACTLTAGNWTTINVNGGTVTNSSAAGTVGTLNLRLGATYYHNGAGTITTANVTGTLDLSKGTGALTITTLTVYPGAIIYDPNGRLATSTDIVFAGGATVGTGTDSDVTIRLGFGRTLRKTV